MTGLSPPMYTTEKNTVQFSEDVTQNEVATNKAGRAMFDKVLRIHVMVPGQKDVMTYEVEREYPDGFPNAVYGKVRVNEGIYKRFKLYVDEYKKNNATQAVSGTPIDRWTLVDVRMAATFKHIGIHTVEALAAVTDSNIANLGMGGREWVRKAKEWLQDANNAAAASEARAQAAGLQAQLAAMQEQLDAFGKAFEVLNPDEQAKVKAELGKSGRRRAA